MSWDAANLRALVVGAGSIGRRHMRNLQVLGCHQISACDPDADRLAALAGEPGTQLFASYERALEATEPEIVLVCTPPALHVPQALAAIEAGAHVFVEKPLSHSLDGVDELIGAAQRGRRVVQVGYNLRFHPGLQLVKRQIEHGEIGRVLWAHVEFGQYLPDWRPWQDYRQSYTARKELGGGIILDASHEIDYTLWLMGRPVELICMAGHVSRLEVDVEDSATLLLRFADGSQADVHIDFVQRGYSRHCRLVGEQGTLVWDYAEQAIAIFRPDQSRWERVPYDFEANQMYMLELQSFLACCAEQRRPDVDLLQARYTLEIALAARESAVRRAWIDLAQLEGRVTPTRISA